MLRLSANFVQRLVALSLATLWGVLPVEAALGCACGPGCSAKSQAAAPAEAKSCCAAKAKVHTCCAGKEAAARPSCCCERPALAQTSCNDCRCTSLPTTPTQARVVNVEQQPVAAPAPVLVAWANTIPPIIDLHAAKEAASDVLAPPPRILFSVWRN